MPLQHTAPLSAHAELSPVEMFSLKEVWQDPMRVYSEHPKALLNCTCVHVRSGLASLVDLWLPPASDHAGE
ncbi:UNVERIFIED_CONTAM: hypothetical protein K2H54_073840 [Gekko kuhli]